LQGQVEACFGRYPDVEIYRSQPGLGEILGARVLGEFGDDPDRYHGARARKNYAGNAPIARASGKKTVVLARFVRNHRLSDALHQQAFSALRASPGARAHYDQLAPAALGTTPRYASSATVWSASCTAASRPTPPTTSTSPGHTTRTKINPPPLDDSTHGMSDQ
jgi:hypothetical protein